MEILGTYLFILGIILTTVMLLLPIGILSYYTVLDFKRGDTKDGYKTLSEILVIAFLFEPIAIFLWLGLLEFGFGI